MYILMFACFHVWIYVCIHICMHAYTYASMIVCVYADWLKKKSRLRFFSLKQNIKTKEDINVIYFKLFLNKFSMKVNQ